MPSIVKIPRTAVRRVAADQKPAPAQEARPIILYANDAYANPAAKLGYGADVLSEGVEYPLVRLTMNYMLLLSLYRGSGVLKKIVNKPVEDAIAHWYQITSQLSPEQTDMLAKLEKRTRLKKRIECGLKWGRLFGGAAGLIMIDGHGDILEQPLDLKTIEPDSFKGLYVVDRWSGLYPSTETVDDINDPDFGEPEFYNVRVSETATDNARVHHSRIVRFTGDELPYWETQVEQGWGASVIETIFDELRQYDDIRHNIAQLVYQANVWIQKSDDLAQSLALAPAAAQARLYATMQAQNRLMSSFTTRVIGKDDDISSRAYSFAGLDSVFTMCKEALSCVSEIPITILFGESPGGMNSTGESDLTNYYTKVEGIQENEIQPVLDRLLPIMCMSEFGAVPDDLDYKFGPVRVPSEEEKAELAGKKTEAVMKVYDGGLIGRKTALKELRDQSEDSGIFTNITDEMIDEADDEVQQGDMPGMPGFGGTPGMPGEETTPSAPGDVPTGPQDGPAPAQPSPTLQITPPAGQPPAPPQTQPTAAPRAPSEQREEDSAPIVAPSPQKSFAERVAGITNYILQRIRGTDTWAESEHPPR
jgi:phage-related protein (TIGR01555 family)